MRRAKYFFDTNFFYTKLFNWSNLARVLAIVMLCCASDSCAMQRLKNRLGLDRADELKNREANKRVCLRAAQRGDVAMVRTLLEAEAEKYMPGFRMADAAKGTTRMGRLMRPLLKYKQRNGQLQGHMLSEGIQEDLNQLACIAVLRLDQSATSMLLSAGADVQATMTTEFTDAQVAQVSDTYRNPWVRFYPNKYTPLLYVAGLLRVDSGQGDREVGDLALVRELVRVGADFRRSTPSGRIPYQEAPDRVRAVIAQAEHECAHGEQVNELVGPEDQELVNQELEQGMLKCLERIQNPQNAKLIMGFLVLAAGSVLLETLLF